MLISLTRINNGPKVHAVFEQGKTLCGQPLEIEPESCGTSVHVTCIGCQKMLVNQDLLDQDVYLLWRRLTA